jgi:hypothetical protein
MKKVIERLEQVEAKIMLITAAPGFDDTELCNEAINLINEAIAELKAPPRWETPEQWEKRTGEKWPDNGAVYYKCRYDFAETWSDWKIKSLGDAIWESGGYTNYQIVCATEAGLPPNNWWPGEKQ